LYKKAVEKELKQEETKLKGLENELIRLQKQNRSLNSKIGDAQKEEATLKGEVRQNELLLDSPENDQIVNLGATDQEARAKLEKQLRADEKDLKKAKNDQNKYEKRARKNLNEQKDKTSQIETQKQVIRNVKTKLENIR
jgi:septal ring factor EnvC (AmiA/AmiB activator)